MQECDLIMKGGVTSGVVYPNAIAEVAEHYRLRNIGGTSAGAIGAVFAAAGEYRRQTTAAGGDPMTGFAAIRALAKELGAIMQSLFQPAPPFRLIFSMLIALLDRSKSVGVVRAILPVLVASFWLRFLAGLVLGGLVAALGWATGSPWWFAFAVVMGLFVFAVVSALLVALALGRTVLRDLPAHDFGICTGLSEGDPETHPGFTDWIADQIDIIAGNLGSNGKPAAPLTVGQLLDQGINVAAVTTDLSTGRPFQLPLKARLHLFSRREFESVVPARVLEYLTPEANRFRTQNPRLPNDLYWLPTGRDFPVMLVARISLSFPGLIRAVPLYRFDDQFRTGSQGQAEIRRCIFSDGGISSNFPIHFFDAMLPTRPTFGISLADWEEKRHGGERVVLPEKWKQSTNLAVQGISGIGGFFGAILNAAKDWQDTLQSLLPGYAERIVHIRLDGKREGGLNLNMDDKVIGALSDFGAEAGRKLVNDFDFNEHRYRRALSLLPEMEEALEAFSQAYDAAPEAPVLPYAELLTTYPPRSYRQNSDTWRRDVLDALARSLADIGRKGAAAHRAAGKKSVRKGDTPAVDCTLRLVADTDRAPQP